MNKFCTYLTIYRGNLLPPFYIGYTSANKIRKGYRGTVTSSEYRDIWKKEQQQNPHLFVTIILTYHKTREEASIKETYFQKHFNVHINPLYTNKSIGGERWIRGKASKEEKAKRSRNHHMRGKSYEEIYGIEEASRLRKIRSEKLKGRKKSKIHIKRMSKSRLNKGVKTYRLLTPDNKEIIITNLFQFCKENNLDNGTLCATMTKNYKHKGYKLLSKITSN